MEIKNKSASWWRLAIALMIGAASVFGLSAQNSLPAPGSGGSYRPAQSGWGGGRPSYGGRPGWGGPSWGSGFGPVWSNSAWNNSPWNNSVWNTWNSEPSIIINGSSGSANQGTENVVACGYDNQGIWRTLPLNVSYQWNGVEYDVTVLNAWNPWTQTWNIGVDQPAYNTSYYINGNTYNFYAPLTTGTYYFNL